MRVHGTQYLTFMVVGLLVTAATATASNKNS